MRHPFPSPTPRLIRVAPPLSDLCGVFWDSYCFCVATCETTGLLPVCHDRCLISGWHYIIHTEGTRNWKKMSRGLMWSVRGFSNSLRVVDKSVVLCISGRVEESPIDTFASCCLRLPLAARNPVCAIRSYDPFYWFKNTADRKAFQIRIVDLEDLSSSSYSRYSTFEWRDVSWRLTLDRYELKWNFCTASFTQSSTSFRKKPLGTWYLSPAVIGARI